MPNFCGKHSFFGGGKRMGRGFFSMGDWVRSGCIGGRMQTKWWFWLFSALTQYRLGYSGKLFITITWRSLIIKKKKRGRRSFSEKKTFQILSVDSTSDSNLRKCIIISVGTHELEKRFLPLMICTEKGAKRFSEIPKSMRRYSKRWLNIDSNLVTSHIFQSELIDYS